MLGGGVFFNVSGKINFDPKCFQPPPPVKGASALDTKNQEFIGHKYYVSGHYSSSCFSLKTQRFGDWILNVQKYNICIHVQS
jgi:hypothetical protein